MSLISFNMHRLKIHMPDCESWMWIPCRILVACVSDQLPTLWVIDIALGSIIESRLQVMKSSSRLSSSASTCGMLSAG